MHDSIRTLLELDDVNKQRQILTKRREERQARLSEATKAATVADEAATAAQADVDKNGALIRQYENDLARCDESIQKARAQQMEASTNKAYLACINAIEKAKAEKTAREESLLNLQAQIEEQQKVADEAKAKAEAAHGIVGEIETEIAAQSDADTSEAELDRIYTEKKADCDPKFLEVYERLVKSKHPRPLMQVDGRTRATPMGNCINTNALESLRLGQLITDPVSNAILYVDE